MFSKIEKYFKSSRFKITLWYSFIFLLLEIVLGAIIYFYINRTMRNELDYSLKKQAETIYKFIKENQEDIFEFEPDSVYSSTDELVYDIIFEALTYNPNNTYVQISINNKIVFRTANLGDIKFKISESNDSLKLLNYYEPNLSDYPIRTAYLKKGGYTIIVAFPLELISKTLNNLTYLYIRIAPLFLLFSLIGGFFISLKALARIDKIIKRTDEIDTFNLDESLEGEEYEDEYGRLVRTINRMLKRIKNSIEYMNQFTINASHELKTPLTILRGELELALKSPKTNEEYLEIIKSSYEETLRLINIVEQLFFITKLDNSLIKLNRTKVDLIKLISGTIQYYNNAYQQNKLKFIVQPETTSEIFVYADADMIRQVFINLIDNAFKYSLEGSDILIIANANNKENVSVSIKNKSEPIPTEILPKLFERFYRAETSRNRNYGGVGLGLSVVKHIMDIHNFDVQIEYNNSGEFVITLNFKEINPQDI